MKTRTRLAEETRGLHQHLHDNQMLSKLVQRGITKAEYASALGIFMHFYGAIEAARLRSGCWHEYSLRRGLVALRTDLGTKRVSMPPFTFMCSAEALGGLYVAQGSFFGREVMRASILQSMPSEPHHFIRCRLSTQVWRGLCSDLEVCGATNQGYRKVLAGATKAFKLMSDLATSQRPKDHT